MPEELEKLLAEKPTDNLYRKLAVYLTSHTDYNFETYVRCVRFIGAFARRLPRRFSHKTRDTTGNFNVIVRTAECKVVRASYINTFSQVIDHILLSPMLTGIGQLASGFMRCWGWKRQKLSVLSHSLSINWGTLISLYGSQARWLLRTYLVKNTISLYQVKQTY